MPVDHDHAPDRPAPGVADADAARPAGESTRRIDARVPGPALVLGVGASRGCPAAELRALVDATLAEAGLSPASVAAVASADVKADEPAILALAADLGVPTRFLPAAALAAVDVPTPSAVVASHVGTPSVAEAAALLVADELRAPEPPQRRGGPALPADAGTLGRATASRLLVPKRRGAHATCAVAVSGVRSTTATSPPGAPQAPTSRPHDAPSASGVPQAPTSRPHDARSAPDAPQAPGGPDQAPRVAPPASPTTRPAPTEVPLP